MNKLSGKNVFVIIHKLPIPLEPVQLKCSSGGGASSFQAVTSIFVWNLPASEMRKHLRPVLGGPHGTYEIVKYEWVSMEKK